MDLPDQHPSNFVDEATDPWRWYVEAEGLLYNSRILWLRSSKKLGEMSGIDESEDEHGRLSWRAASLMKSSMLLAGLSLENALKGHLIEERPGDVELETRMDGNGQLTDAEFKKIGDSDINHDLIALAREAELFEVANNPSVSAPEEISEFKNHLRFLKKSVRWHARYPTSITYSDEEELRDEILPDGGNLSFYMNTFGVAWKVTLTLLPAVIENEIEEIDEFEDQSSTGVDPL